MQLKEMYEKPIDRDIKGVIKVGQDDNENIKQELEEYVLTDEIYKYINDFYDSYKKSLVDYTDKMGVWISGFFGSGKSHFLKILSYLLENKLVDNKYAVEYFNEKIKDPMLIADMRKSSDITTDVILFNIDSKSESQFKSSRDAILKVFNKVFDEMQGYCGSLPWVADMERQMVKENVYDKFKEEFHKESGSLWEESREDIFYEEDAVITSLMNTRNMSEESARNWFNKAEENYTLSIEKFAKRVSQYLESKGNNHHVVFLVDEIGQYIGDDSQLMLNLQTVVEDLGTYCGGKCWVIVTSQQDIDSITKVKGNDFSKIQGRFNTRLSLSSSNVDEVIKKRLLSKNQGAKDSLQILYDKNSSILKNLITFSSDTAEMKTYQDYKDFSEIYPFIPYQFNLLQKVFEGVRTHGASGKHISEGERSLLGAFQESAVKYNNQEIGTLIPFNTFYDTIETFLDGTIKSVVNKAKDNDRLKEFDVEVLKLLFLLKYVKEVRPNLENIATLMVKNIDEDKIELKKNIQISLNRLIRETLVQKNGELYIFLTDDEQDINKEINNISIEISETINKVGEIVFEEIYKNNKFRYSPKRDFSFNKYIDSTSYGLANNEIGIRIITPYNDLDDMSEQDLRMLSARENNVIIKLANDTTFLEEIESSLKIERYMRLNSALKSNSNIEAIKLVKAGEKNERRERANLLLRELIRTSDIYVNNEKLDIKEKNPEERINDALRSLVDIVYSKLGYIKKSITSTKEIVDILLNDNNQVTIDSLNENPNKNAVDEINRYIERQSIGNNSITVKSIINHFVKAPFGWSDLDIEGIIAYLFKNQNIKMEFGGENLSTNDKNVTNYITKRDNLEKTKIKTRVSVPDNHIKAAKNISNLVFNTTITKFDEDSVMIDFKDTLKDNLNYIKQLLEQYRRFNYPGKKILERGQELIEEVLSYKEPVAFFKTVNSLKLDFEDYGDDVADVLSFFKQGNPQKKNFETAIDRIEHSKENMSYLDEEAKELIEQMKKIVNMESPYKKIHELPIIIDKYNDKLVELYEEEAKKVRPIIKLHQKEVIDYLSKFDFYEEFKSEYFNRFENLNNELNSVRRFSDIVAIPDKSDRIKNQCIKEIDNEYKNRIPKGAEDRVNDCGGGSAVLTKEDNKQEDKEAVLIAKSSIIPYQPVIKSREDIDKLIKSIEIKLEKELEEKGEFKLV